MAEDPFKKLGAVLEEEFRAEAANDPFASIGAEPVVSPQEAAARRQEQLKAEIGTSPQLPKLESPLDAFERVQLGFADKPGEQLKFLENRFGAQNVELINSTESELGFVVNTGSQKAPDWRVVDPTGMSDIPGDIAQFVGRKGVQAVGAAVGGIKGAAAGTAVGGPIGGVLGGLIGAGIGSAAGEVGVMGFRAGLEAIDPETVGSRNPDNVEEVKRQLGSAVLFGMGEEIGGRAVKIAGKLTAKTMGGVLNRIRNTPESKAAASKVFSFMSGQSEPLARARVENPVRTAIFDERAAKDLVTRKDSVRGFQIKALEGLEKRLRTKIKQTGVAYSRIDRQAVKARFDPSKQIDTFVEELKANRFVLEGEQIAGTTAQKAAREVGELVPNVAGSDKRALKGILSNIEATQNKIKSGKKLNISDMKIMLNDLDNPLFAKESIQNSNLGRIMKQYRAELKNKFNTQLDEFSPALKLGTRRAALDRQFGPSRNLLEDLAPKTADKKVDSFLNRIVQNNRLNTELVSSVSSTVGSANPTDDILRAESARQATDLFKGFQFTGKGFIPRVPSTAARAATAAGQTRNAVNELLKPAVPFMNEALKGLRRMDPIVRSKLMRDPQFVDALSRAIAGGVESENQTFEQLIRGSGVLGE